MSREEVDAIAMSDSSHAGMASNMPRRPRHLHMKSSPLYSALVRELSISRKELSGLPKETGSSIRESYCTAGLPIVSADRQR